MIRSCRRRSHSLTHLSGAFSHLCCWFSNVRKSRLSGCCRSSAHLEVFHINDRFKQQRESGLDARRLHAPARCQGAVACWRGCHFCRQRTSRGLVSHLGWSQCLEAPIAIIIPIHPKAVFAAAKIKNNLEGFKSAASLLDRADIRGCLLVPPDI